MLEKEGVEFKWLHKLSAARFAPVGDLYLIVYTQLHHLLLDASTPISSHDELAQLEDRRLEGRAVKQTSSCHGSQGRAGAAIDR